MDARFPAATRMPLRQLIDTLRADLSVHTERGRMVRSAGATAALKVGATLLAFGASLIYARALGPHGYGLYAYVVAWAAVITIPVTMGLPGYLVREAAKQSTNMRRLRRWADRRVLVAGVLATVLMVCVWFLPQAAGARWLFVVAAALPLINVLQQVRSALLRARGLVARSQWPNLIAGPALMLIVLALIWGIRGRLQPIEVTAALVGAGLLALIINQIQLARTPSIPVDDSEISVRLRSALPFMWLGGLYLLNSRVDLIMLGAMKGASDAGIYAIATRAAELVTFIVTAANMTLQPRIARLYHEGNRPLLQRMITSAAKRVLLASLPLALLLIIAAWWLLDLLYGRAFTPAAVPLQILASAQLIVVGFGSVGTIVNMAGHERQSMKVLAFAVAINIVLNALLIPPLGIIGAAIATGVSRVLAQATLWWWLRWHLHIRSSAFGL